ncbi:MAG: Type 1 glutamine amidotransferase-like domain-containing protein [Clostridiales bacterium]|nr:Type 1 glutamine amidotransferase-like domain-containing protein [Candidatus Coliplasma caballi]
MKFILSSNDFSNPEMIAEEIGKPFSEIRLLYIPNEKANEKQMRGDKFKEKMTQFGFRAENVSVLNYYQPESAKDLDLDAIFMSGGNTFGIMYRLRKHGVLGLIEEYIRKGVVYIGASAGCHVIGKGIAHVAPFDQNTVGLEDFSALGLFDGIFFCHYGEARRPYYEEALKTSECPVYTIPNGTSLVIEDGVLVRTVVGEPPKRREEQNDESRFA